MPYTSRLKRISKFSAPVRLIIFIGALAILWLPLAITIYWLLQKDPNLACILTMALLFVELLFFWKFWGRVVHDEFNIFARYGLVRNKKNTREFFQGLGIGFWLCLGLFITEALFGWIEIVNPGLNLIRIAIEGLLSAVGIALAEELLFRGWLLDELQRDYGKKICIGVTALVFAVAHFFRPIEEIIRMAVTFPALVFLGIALVLAKYKYGDRLGICIGIHTGLVWGYYIVNVGQLIKYSDRIPVWVTGIDGNPIAGVMGLLFLAGLTWIMSTDERG
ncbi:MAG: type II CAAX endopeptidase family protein [Waterburya sp.]